MYRLLIPMQRSCHQCAAPFEVTNDDLAFLEKVSPVFNGKKGLLPPPTLCPDCRQQRRLAQRNERNLYHRPCDLCKHTIISIYAADYPFSVYCPSCWWSDVWDPLTYGRPFDFRRTFFEQFRELWNAVPKIALIVLSDNVNSDYVQDCGHLKNCYLVFDGGLAEDSYYGEVFVRTKDCCDFFFLIDAELCYECVHCTQCTNLRNSRFCSNCSDAAFLLDCAGCRHCLGCTNLRQKEYCILNTQYTKEEYERRRAALRLDTHAGIDAFRREAEAFFRTQPRRALRGSMNDNVRGDNLIGCKDTFDSFDCNSMRDCRFCTNCPLGAADAYDVDAWGDRLSLAYNCAYIGEGTQNVIGCYYAGFGANNVFYSAYCLGGSRGDLFGCVSLKKNGYCVLNAQHTKEECHALIPRIIAHMQETGEWGEFFPIELSAFAYNETVAQNYYPLTREDVLARGWKWRKPEDAIPDTTRMIDAANLPERIEEVSDDILHMTIRCAQSQRPFKITKQELILYRKLGVPLPRQHFEIRHSNRLALCNPRKLWSRTCAKCGAAIQTTYDPKRPEIVYCEECYLKEVY